MARITVGIKEENYMKKVLIYLWVFFILIVASNYGIDYSVGKQLETKSPYYLAFTSIGANSLEFQLDCWAKIKTISTKEELQIYLQSLLKTLNLPEEDASVFHFKKEGLILQYEVNENNEKYSIILESDNKTNETYFIINVVSPNEIIIKNIPEKLNKMIGINWSFYYLYSCLIEVPLDSNGRTEMIDVIVKNLNVNNVKMFELSDLTSFTGYSPLLNKYAQTISVNGEKINIQVALRSDKEVKKTYVLIGSPLILNDY